MILNYLLASAALLSAAAAGFAQTPPPQWSAITRTNLLRHDLSIAGHEAIQVRVDFAVGAAAPRHSHPGEELVYVLSGTLDYRLDGRPPVTLRPGDVLVIPAGAIHAVTNSGTGSASELATYIVDKSRPLITPAP